MNLWIFLRMRKYFLNYGIIILNHRRDIEKYKIFIIKNNYYCVKIIIMK